MGYLVGLVDYAFCGSLVDVSVAGDYQSLSAKVPDLVTSALSDEGKLNVGGLGDRSQRFDKVPLLHTVRLAR